MAEALDAQGGLTGRWAQVANLSAVGALMLLLFLIVYWVREDGLSVVKDIQATHRQDLAIQREEFAKAIEAFKDSLRSQQEFERQMRSLDREMISKLTSAVERVVERAREMP